MPDFVSTAGTGKSICGDTSTREWYTQSLQLFSPKIIGLFTCARDAVESVECRSYQSGLSGRFNVLARALSILAVDRKPPMPIPKVLQKTYLMEAFHRTSKSSVLFIDGHTQNTVHDYRSRSDISATSLPRRSPSQSASIGLATNQSVRLRTLSSTNEADCF